jgi:hypothetical protein
MHLASPSLGAWIDALPAVGSADFARRNAATERIHNEQGVETSVLLLTQHSWCLWRAIGVLAGEASQLASDAATVLIMMIPCRRSWGETYVNLSHRHGSYHEIVHILARLQTGALLTRSTTALHAPGAGQPAMRTRRVLLTDSCTIISGTRSDSLTLLPSPPPVMNSIVGRWVCGHGLLGAGQAPLRLAPADDCSSRRGLSGRRRMASWLPAAGAGGGNACVSQLISYAQAKGTGRWRNPDTYRMHERTAPEK